MIVNSSGGWTGKNWDNLDNQVRQIIGRYPEVAFSKKPGDGTTLARDFLRKGFKKVVALGGDGTINEVANGFFEDIRLENYDNYNLDRHDKISRVSVGHPNYPEATHLNFCPYCGHIVKG